MENLKNKEIYSLLCKGAQIKNREIVDYNRYLMEICSRSSLDYRTVNTLIKIIDKEGVEYDDIEKFLSPSFYTLENAISLYKKGFEDVIPADYFQNEEFITKAKVTKIPDGFVENNQKITFFNILPGIQYIGNNAFRNCPEIMINNFPDSITYIGHHAFENNKKIEEINISSAKYIGVGAFRNNTLLRKVILPSSMHNIEENLFEGCVSLESVTLNKMVAIGDEAFADCISLKNIDSILIKVGKESFKNCKSLTKIVLSTSYIDKRAFLNASKLEDVIFRTYCPSKICKEAFSGCLALKNIKVNDFVYNLYSMKGYDEISDNIDIVFNSIKGYTSSCEIFTSKSIENISKNI